MRCWKSTKEVRSPGAERVYKVVRHSEERCEIRKLEYSGLSGELRRQTGGAAGKDDAEPQSPKGQVHKTDNGSNPGSKRDADFQILWESPRFHWQRLAPRPAHRTCCPLTPHFPPGREVSRGTQGSWKPGAGRAGALRPGVPRGGRVRALPRARAHGGGDGRGDAAAAAAGGWRRVKRAIPRVLGAVPRFSPLPPPPCRAGQSGPRPAAGPRTTSRR